MAENNNNGKRNEPTHKPEPDVRMSTRAATGTVVVGTKIPNGIILQLCAETKELEPIMGGSPRDVKIGRKIGDTYLVKGPAVKFGEIPKVLMVGGYAFTSGIPEDFWNEWVKQNHDAEILKKGLIIAHKQMESLEDECRNNEKLRSGLEPLDTTNLPRGIKTADEQKAPIR